MMTPDDISRLDRLRQQLDRFRQLSAQARVRTQLHLPAGYRPLVFSELITAFEKELPTLASGMIGAVVKAAKFENEDRAVTCVADLEATGLVAFAISPDGAPAVFTARADAFTRGEEYMASRGLVEFFDVHGEYNSATGQIISLPVTIEQWAATSVDTLDKLAAVCGLSKRVILDTLHQMEKEGITNIRNATKAEDGSGYLVHMTVPDSRVLTNYEKRVIEAFRREFSMVDGSGVDDLMSVPTVKYAQAEYMRAIEAQVDALKLTEDYRVKARHAGMDTDDFDFDANALRIADTYCWFRDPEIAVQAAAASLPEAFTCEREMIDGYAGWWYMVDAMGVSTDDSNEPIKAILWKWDTWTYPTEFGTSVTRAGLVIEAFVGNKPKHHGVLTPTTRFFWREGLTLAQMLKDSRALFVQRYLDNAEALAAGDRHQQACEYMARFFAAGVLWIRQRIIVEQKQPVERHYRKRVNRDRQPDEHVREVRVIQLRRRQNIHEATPGSGKSVDWKCRWNVIGHWRRQPYKTTGKVETIWIKGYLKGPDDKPVKGPTAPRPIYSVNR